MYEGQHFVDLQENSDLGDPNSWLSTGENSSFTLTQSSLADSTAANANLDRVLFNDLVQIVPLVQSLIDRKASSSFTRRGSMIYTKTPSRESLSKRITDLKGRNVAQSIPAKKKKDHGEKEQGKNGSNNPDGDSFSMFSSRGLTLEKDGEEVVILKEQIEELQRKLLEKDELLESAENSRNQMNTVNAKLNELKHQASEKDSLLKSTQQQLSDAKIKLADKQAALEKIKWEAMTSKNKVEKLLEELDSMQGDISSFTLLLGGLTKIDTAEYTDDYDIKPYDFNHQPSIDDLHELEMLKMEEARKAYIAAVAAAKEKPDEESVSTAANASYDIFFTDSGHQNSESAFASSMLGYSKAFYSLGGTVSVHLYPAISREGPVDVLDGGFMMMVVRTIAKSGLLSESHMLLNDVGSMEGALEMIFEKIPVTPLPKKPASDFDPYRSLPRGSVGSSPGYAQRRSEGSLMRSRDESKLEKQPGSHEWRE